MALFLDSADPSEAREAAGYGFVRGCTTNPALLARAGARDPRAALEVLVDLFEGPVFYQLMARDLEGLRAEARTFLPLGPRLGLKIACTLDGLRLAAELAPEATLAMTGVFTPGQAYLAAQAGAHYVIPYVNRITRFTGDGPGTIDAIAEALAFEDCAVLAAGIKSPAEAIEALLAGADHLSLPLSVIQSMADNELTRRAIDDFEAAWRGAG